MKSTKTLSLTNQLKLEATFYDTGTDLAFVIGKKEYKLSDNEIKELVSWVQKEVLGSEPEELLRGFGPVLSKAERTQIEKLQAEKALIVNPNTAKPIAFDKQVAAKAFSKDHIFDGGQVTGDVK